MLKRLRRKIKNGRLIFSRSPTSWNKLIFRFLEQLPSASRKNAPWKNSPPFFDITPLHQKLLFLGFESWYKLLPTLCHRWKKRPPLCQRKELINQVLSTITKFRTGADALKVIFLAKFPRVLSYSTKSTRRSVWELIDHFQKLVVRGILPNNNKK